MEEAHKIHQVFHVQDKDSYTKCLSSSSLSSSSEEEKEEDDQSSSASNASLYDLSEMMAQLPIKRGLSQFYQGKSESFTSLARVTSIEDLAKRAKVVKTSKSGLKGYKAYTLPKPIISKKSKRASLSFPSGRRGRLTPLHKNFMS